MRNKMIRKVLIVLILVTYAVSESCVRYTFEEDFNELFTRQRGLCVASDQFWVVGKYNDIDLSNENDQHNTFITPAFPTSYSCASSFSFLMAPGATIEVNTYMETSTSNVLDYIMIAAYQLGTNDRLVGDADRWAGALNFVPGWHTLKIIISAGATIGDGYVSILGRKSQNSIVLVDSFRYIPPGMDESSCRLYEDEPEPVPSTPEPTTPDPTTPEETTPFPTTPESTTLGSTTPESTTPDQTTPVETTPYSTTLESTTPYPATPESTTLDPTTPELITLDPTTPEVTTPNPITPEETTPDSITPEVTTPDPTTSEETTPDPTTPEETTPENNHRYLLTIETWIKTQLSTSSKTM